MNAGEICLLSSSINSIKKAAEAKRLKDENQQLKQELDEIYADSTVQLCANCNSNVKQSDQAVQQLESELKNLLIDRNETTNLTLKAQSTVDLNVCQYIEREEDVSPFTSSGETNQLANTPEEELEMLRKQTKRMMAQIKTNTTTINDLYADICEMGTELKVSNVRQNKMKQEIIKKTREFEQLKVQKWQLEIQLAHLSAQKCADNGQSNSSVKRWTPTANLFQPSPNKRPKLMFNQLLAKNKAVMLSKFRKDMEGALKHVDPKNKDETTNLADYRNASASDFSFDVVPMHKAFEFNFNQPKDEEPHPPCANELVNIEEWNEVASVSSPFIDAFASSNHSIPTSSNENTNEPQLTHQQLDYKFMNLSTSTALSFSSDDSSDEFGPLVSAKSFSSSTGSWEALNVESTEN
ncbi:hypothetical protein M3Y98_00678100 [Aphelenchoides besseyi]|nr:hypothetical protein M3Y98_00678100 [Aphelenchoides besseyi]